MHAQHAYKPGYLHRKDSLAQGMETPCMDSMLLVQSSKGIRLHSSMQHPNHQTQPNDVTNEVLVNLVFCTEKDNAHPEGVVL